MMLQSRFLSKSGAAFVTGGERAALLPRVRIYTQTDKHRDPGVHLQPLGELGFVKERRWSIASTTQITAICSKMSIRTVKGGLQCLVPRYSKWLSVWFLFISC